MKEVKIYTDDVNSMVELMKTLDNYKGNESGSHDAYLNGYHIYLYEGQENGGGIMHVNKING